MVAEPGPLGPVRRYLSWIGPLIVSDGIGLVLNSWLSNLYRPEFIVAAAQEITGMKVTEVGRPAARTGSSASQIPARNAAPTVRWSCGLR
jgi:hypothetical protein